jgi:hypothetical protein
MQKTFSRMQKTFGREQKTFGREQKTFAGHHAQRTIFPAATTY